MRCDRKCAKPVTVGQITAPFVRLYGVHTRQKAVDSGHRSGTGDTARDFYWLQRRFSARVRRPFVDGQAPGIFVPILLRYCGVRGILSRVTMIVGSFGAALDASRKHPRIRPAVPRPLHKRSNNQHARGAACDDRPGLRVGHEWVKAAFRHVICTVSDVEGAARCVRLRSKYSRASGIVTMLVLKADRNPRSA